MAQLTAHPPQNELSHQEKQRTLFDTNVLGPLALTEWIAQTMIDAKTGGSILFLSSIHQWSYYGDVAYSASKAAVGTMVHEMALQLAPHGIRVNGLAPGFVCAEADETPPPHAPTPLHHTAIHPQYIGRAAVYLASDYFSHCTTGTILKIDAGLSLVNYIAMKPPPPPPPRLWIHKTARHYRHQLRQYLKKL